MLLSSSIWRIGIISFLLLLLTACAPDFSEQIGIEKERVNHRLQELGRQLDNKALRYSVLTDNYAAVVAREKPRLAPLAKLLAKEGHTTGRLYRGLQDRLYAIQSKPETRTQLDNSLDELDNIWEASSPSTFNNSLIDIVNTLADLSGGKLPRVLIPNQQQSPPHLAGSYLIGNPNYGRWATSPTGNSQWNWNNNYAPLFDVADDVLEYKYRKKYKSRKVGFNSWYEKQHYSYYNDYGRKKYAPKSDRKRFQKNYTRLKQRAQQKGKALPKPVKSYLPQQKRTSSYAQLSGKDRSNNASVNSTRKKDYTQRSPTTRSTQTKDYTAPPKRVSTYASTAPPAKTPTSSNSSQSKDYSTQKRNSSNVTQTKDYTTTQKRSSTYAASSGGNTAKKNDYSRTAIVRTVSNKKPAKKSYSTPSKRISSNYRKTANSRSSRSAFSSSSRSSSRSSRRSGGSRGK